MISYIFKNKTKNILAIVFTALYTILPFFNTINALNNFRNFLFYFAQLLPYAMLLIYLLTLKKIYKFKELLFPAAFAIKTLFAIYTSIVSAIGILNIADGFQGIYFILRSNFSNIIAIIAFVLCLIGTLFNFKNVRFLKWGTLIFIISILILTPIDFISVGGFDYWRNIPQEHFTSVLFSQIESVIKIAITVLFYFGIFNLTLNKKSEYIDITPLNKKSEATEYQNQFEHEEMLEIPDGFWRCMACGKIVPDSIDQCECGYKK